MKKTLTELLMFRLPSLIFLILMLDLSATRSSAADDDNDFAVSALHAANNIPWSQMTVKILDPEGQPVKGATVRPWALRAGNGHGWWDETTYGSPRRTTTDEAGTTDVIFPQSVAWGVKDAHPVVAVSMVISHPEFCSKNAHVNVPGGDAEQIQEVRLERGVRLRIAGVLPGSDQPLPHCHAMLEDRDVQDEEFVQEKDGWLQSVPIRPDRRWFRIIYLPPGEPPQFSKPTAWTPDDPKSRDVRVEVRPGVRVTGQIDDSVERPIERGHVVAWCGSPAHPGAGNAVGKRVDPIWWIDTVPIAKDGTFEFPSLPSGYLAQIYAFANDAISAQPSDEAFETCCKWFAAEKLRRHDPFRYGQVLRLAGGDPQITIEMEPAGEIQIKCTDPDGKPLSKITVSTWPNQFMVGAGSTVFCARHSTLNQIRGKRRLDWWRDSPYSAVTNANGEVTIRNLPAGKQSLSASGDHWVGKDNENALSEPGKTTVIEMTLERLP